MNKSSSTLRLNPVALRNYVPSANAAASLYPLGLLPESVIRGVNDVVVNAYHDVSAAHLDIYIVGIIGWDITNNDVIRELAKYTGLKTITAYINSLGGGIGEGLGIMNTLRFHEAKVTTINIGYALSMGSLSVLGGDKGSRYMAANSLMMIHRAQGGSFGDADEHEKNKKIQLKHEKVMAAEYKACMNIPEDEIHQKLKDETWYTAEEAKEAGLIDGVIDPVDEAVVDNHLSENSWTNLKESGLTNMPETLKERMVARLNPVALRNSVPSANAAGDPNNPSVAVSNGADGSQPVNSQNTTSAPAGTPQGSQLNPDDIRAQALADEQTRREEITAMFEAHGGVTGQYSEVAQAALNDHTVTVDKARENLLTAIGNESPGAIGGVGNVRITHDEVDTRRDLMTNALLSRSGTAEAMENNPYSFMSLSDIARGCLEAIGQRSTGIHPLQMVSNAFTQTTSDFPVILDRLISEMVLVSYRKKALTWKRFCAVGSVSDFREHKRLRLGSFGTLDGYKEGGEYKNKSIPDGETESVSVGTVGNIIAVTREIIINDDLGYIQRLAGMLGNAAARTVESHVYKLLLSNPKLSDGVPLFHDKHKNIVTGDMVGAMNEIILDYMRQMMASHKDFSGNEELDIAPELLMVPSTMKLEADKWMKSPTLPGQDNAALPNGVAGLADVLATSRLTGNPYYMLADANDVPTIEVNFLFGEEEPFIDNQTGWRTDGAEMKVRLDFGVDAVDYRGVVKNPGK